MRSFLSPLLALLSLAPASAASTYVIDDDGGPGVDFTSIDQAVGVVAWGDVLIVRAGSYSGFSLSVPISIVGEEGALVANGITITGTPSGGRTSLSGLGTGWIRVQNCAGPVLLEELTAATFDVSPGPVLATISIADCVDVRLRGVTVPITTTLNKRQALRVLSSRVEVTHCVLWGAAGKSHNIYTQPGAPGDGGDGIFVGDAATVHVSSSAIRGGWGGDNSESPSLCSSCPGGSGGAGIRMGAGTTVLVTGPAYADVTGGAEGWGPNCDLDGAAGDGITVGANAALQTSGAVIVAGYADNCGPVTSLAIRGPYVQAVPPDPTLTISGPIAVQPVTFTIEGEPGSLTKLFLGRQLVVVDVPGVVEDKLVVPLRSYDLGVLPASGIVTHTFSIPAASPKGAIFVAQGQTTAPGGTVSLTQSIPLTVR